MITVTGDHMWSDRDQRRIETSHPDEVDGNTDILSLTNS